MLHPCGLLRYYFLNEATYQEQTSQVAKNDVLFIIFHDHEYRT